MNSNFYKLIITLFLCLTINSFSQVCNFDFNGGIPGNFTVTGLNEHLGNFYTSCGDESSSENSTGGHATFAVNAPEVSLIQELGISIPTNYNARALKLNPSEFQNSNRTTVTTSSFVITNTILSFDYLQIGMAPNNPYGHTDAYFQYRLLDANDSSVIDSGCFVITDSEDENFNSCGYNYETFPDNNNVLVVFTPDWLTHEINISNISGIGIGSSVKLEFTATDCGGATESGTNNHFNTVYIDNICQSNDTENTFSIDMDAFGSLECPEENFTVSGTYESPNCDNSPVEIKLCMAPYIQGQPVNITNAVELAAASFNDFTFNFNIDPNSLSYEQGQDYNLFVIIDDNDNDLSTYIAIAHDKYEELTFDDCQQIDPCEGASITIANENDFPTCDELDDFWYFPVNIVINTPPGYDLDQANSDYYSNNFSLDIIDLDNDDAIFTTLDTDDMQSGVFQNGILQINYVINYLIMQGANNQGNYAFRVNANLTTDNGICELSYTAYQLSFDNCQEVDPCIINTYIEGNIFCWEDISEEYFIEIIGISDSENILEFTTEDNCLNLKEIAQMIRQKFFLIRVRTKLDCPWTQCHVGVDTESEIPDYDNLFTYYGDCITTYKNVSTILTTKYIKVFPNPAKTTVSITVSNSKIKSIELLDFYGKTIQTKTQINALRHTLNVNQLKRGMYVLKIRMMDGSITIKNLILN